MHITCRYSGVSFLAQGFGKLRLTLEHPIMNVPIKTLLSRSRDWLKGELDETERRLLFIALLKATNCVEFRVPAIPNKQTIESNMDFLIQSVGWLQIIGDHLSLPKYRVTEYTYKIKNIGDWLANWSEIKRSWESKSEDQQLKERLERRQQAIIKLIRSPFTQFRRYQKQLGRIAVDAAGVPGHTKDYWVELFSLKDNKDIMNFPLVDFEEMLEFFQDNLQLHGTVSYQVYHHITELIKVRKGGIEGLIGMEDDENAIAAAHRLQDLYHNPYAIIDDSEDAEIERDEAEIEAERERNRRLFGDAFAGKSSSVITRETEAENKRRLIRLAPLAQPNPKDFGDNKVAYLTQLSLWRIAKREYDKQQEEINKMEEAAKKGRDALNEENSLDLPFADIPDDETTNIINLTARRVEGMKDE